VASVLTAADLGRAMRDSLDALRAQRGAIDAANVYPVPDGDTGTNLVMTFEAVVAALDRAGDAAHDIAHATTSGSLMGARGNSGVIMAQLLRAFAEAVEGGAADVAATARAFKRGTELAYEAVLEPAEGTILTVARAASEAAQGAHADVPAQALAAAHAAREALSHTPEQLPLLARAGVVDAGGMGLVAVLEALARALGARLPAMELPPQPSFAEAAARCALDDDGSGFAHEVQYMLAAPDATIPPLRELLATIGDSIAVIGGDGTWRVHVHTDDPERAVAFGRAIGAVSEFEEISFADQAAAKGGRTARAPEELPARAAGERGITLAHGEGEAILLAVVAGEGARRLFEDLGAHTIGADVRMQVAGDALAAAIDARGDKRVVVLPNNEDVFARAQMLAFERDGVSVLRTADLAQGLAVAVAYGSARRTDDNLQDMLQTLSRLRSGQVVITQGPMTLPDGPVAPGSAIGFCEGEMVEVSPDPHAAAIAVAKRLCSTLPDVLTVLCGDGVSAAERARIEQQLKTALPPVQVEVHDGGQPLHRYLLVAE
jgi:hypothetical protein